MCRNHANCKSAEESIYDDDEVVYNILYDYEAASLRIDTRMMGRTMSSINLYNNLYLLLIIIAGGGALLCYCC